MTIAGDACAIPAIVVNATTVAPTKATFVRISCFSFCVAQDRNLFVQRFAWQINPSLQWIVRVTNMSPALRRAQRDHAVLEAQSSG
jgi:hypothetical protein